MLISPACPSDLPRIATLERSAMARDFVGRWSDERHLATLADGDARYWVSETERESWGRTPSFARLRFN